jgi:hypothetical protein
MSYTAVTQAVPAISLAVRRNAPKFKLGALRAHHSTFYASMVDSVQINWWN